MLEVKQQSGPFTALRLLPTLTTSTADLVRDFFQPLLLRSIAYDRGVGFFSAGWLRINAIGLAALVRNGGRARWVTSPILSQEEWEALRTGMDAANNPILCQSLQRSLDDIEISLATETLSTLAWMVADSLLEFRFAVPTDALSGEFHDKFGVFTDAHGNRVSFNGSYNDSIQGTRNYESLKVFSSWNEATVDMVDADGKRFERLWSGQEPYLRIYTIPDAIRSRIQQYRLPGRPYAPKTNIYPGQTEPTRPALRPYQEEAVAAWEHAGRRGILDMATGTGKTRIALTAARRTPGLQGVIIGVPTDALVSQWQREIRAEGGFTPPLAIVGDSTDWQDQAFNRLCLVREDSHGLPDQLIALVGTYHSLASKRFQTLLQDALPTSASLLFIGDEVHRLGAPFFQQAMREGYGLRLGLTATLTRPFDTEGTAAVRDYFGGVVYSFPFARAVGTVLCRYDYRVEFAELSDKEFEEYQELSQEIAQKTSEAEEERESADLEKGTSELDRLLFRRANVLKRCQDKIRVLRELVESCPLQRCLIYCADLAQADAVGDVLRAAKLPYLSYTSRESPATQEAALRLLGEQRIATVVAIKCLDEEVDVSEMPQVI